MVVKRARYKCSSFKSLDIAGIEVLEQEIKLFQELAVTVTKVALNGSLAAGESIEANTAIREFGKMLKEH